MRDDEDTLRSLARLLARRKGKSFGLGRREGGRDGLQEEYVLCDLFRRREISGQLRSARPDERGFRARSYIAGYRAFPPHVNRDL